MSRVNRKQLLALIVVLGCVTTMASSARAIPSRPPPLGPPLLKVMGVLVAEALGPLIWWGFLPRLRA